MTIEELNRKLERINTRLEGVISDMYVTYDESKLQSNANALQNEILGDPNIQRILTTGSAEERQAYMQAIENGAKRVKQQLEALRDNTSMNHNRVGITGIVNASNKDVFEIAKTAKDVATTDFSVISGRDYADRKIEISKKIGILDSVLEVEGKVTNAKTALTNAGMSHDTGNVKNAVEAIETARAAYTANVNKCNDVFTMNLNFKEELEKLSNLMADPSVDMGSQEAKSLITKLRKASIRINEVAAMTSIPEIFAAADIINENELSDRTAVTSWIASMNATVANPAHQTMLSSKDMLNDFLQEQVDVLKENFVNELDASIVLSKFLSQEQIAELKTHPTESTSKDMISQIITGIENYKKYIEDRGLNRGTLELQKAELKRKAQAYTDLTMDQHAVTINGKSLIFSNTMMNPAVDEASYRDYMQQIQEQATGATATTQGREFAEELRNKALALVDPKPINRWYQRFGEWITRGRYQSPETRWENNLYFKQTDVLRDAISENRTKLDGALEVADNDTKEYGNKIMAKAVADKKSVTRQEKKKIRSELDAFDGR